MNFQVEDQWLATLTLSGPDGQRWQACAAARAGDAEACAAALREAVVARGWQLVALFDLCPPAQIEGDYHLDGEAEALLSALDAGPLLAFGRLCAPGQAVHSPCAPHWLHVQVFGSVAPLDVQRGGGDRKTVPEALQDALFGDPLPQAEAPLETYAVLDAATMPLIEERLGLSGLRHRALFKGAAQDELAAAAPWLVELRDGNSFTRGLFTAREHTGDGFAAGPGFYLRSRAGFDRLWSHLRKFTLLRDETGNGLFFRFWAEPVMSRLLACGNRAELRPLLAAFLPAGADTPLEAIVRFNSTLCCEVRRAAGGPEIRPDMVLNAEIRTTMRLLRRAEEFNELIEIARSNCPDDPVRAPARVRAHLRARRDLWYDLGFWRRDHLVKLCVWELLLGPNFLETHGAGAIRAIVQEGRAPHETIALIERYLNREYALSLGYTPQQIEEAQ